LAIDMLASQSSAL